MQCYAWFFWRAFFALLQPDTIQSIRFFSPPYVMPASFLKVRALFLLRFLPVTRKRRVSWAAKKGKSCFALNIEALHLVYISQESPGLSSKKAQTFFARYICKEKSFGGRSVIWKSRRIYCSKLGRYIMRRKIIAFSGRVWKRRHFFPVFQ